MASFLQALKSLLILLVTIANINLSACKFTVKGSVSCLDCPSHHDLSGILLAAACSHERRLVTMKTNQKGLFEAKIPSNSGSPPSNCFVKLIGGSKQLCSFKKSMVSKLIRTRGSKDYSLSAPLTLFTSCPSKVKNQGIGSSKTIDLPLPREWGLAPSSYYIPYFPIIGIP